MRTEEASNGYSKEQHKCSLSSIIIFLKFFIFNVNFVMNFFQGKRYKFINFVCYLPSKPLLNILFYMFKILQIQGNNNKPMNERLLQSVLTQHDIYDPFQSPPNLEKAAQHRQAMSVGIDADEGDDPRICPCCQNIIQKQPISLCCKDEDLLFLGVGYSLFYKLTRYFSLIILLIFVISGSGFYLIVTLKCKTQCVFFFGIPIINLEIPVEETAKMTDVVNVITAICIFLIVLYVKSHIREEIGDLQSKVISLQQYTIMLQNLPTDIDEDELEEWVKEKFKVKPKLINFAYDVKELANAYQTRHDLTIKYNKLKIQKRSLENSAELRENLDKKIEQISQKLKKQDRILNHYKQENISCNKTGTAFVTFSKPTVVKEILLYQTSFINTALKSLCSIIKSPPLSFKDQQLWFKYRTIIVKKAPAPREVIWENLSFSYLRSIVFEILFFATMVFLIFIAFKIQYRFVRYAYELRQKSTTSGQFIIVFEALIMSLIVVSLNSFLRLVIKFFTHLKRYYSFTSFHSSFCFYYSLMYILNTCFMIYIVHGHITIENFPQAGLISEQDQVLLYDIHLIMVANAFSEPLFKLLDPEMWWRILWRKYVSTLKRQQNPYTQAYVNKLWEGYEISNADNYQYIYRILIITTWYAHSAPLGVILSLIGLSFDYWIGRYLLLRVYRRPENISKQIAMSIIMSLELLPLIYICGLLQFTYKVSKSSNIFNFLSEFLQYGITTTVILFCILGYLIFFRPKQTQISHRSYDEVEVLFPYTYETQNPITKLKGQIKFLYGVLKRGASQRETKLINELLTLSQKSKDSFVERKSMIFKIKRNVLRRATTLENAQEMKEFKRSSDSSDKNI